MNYRHGYHAGNFADVHKHVVLLALIEALQRKDKGFLYVDTHAGRGWYDLRSVEAQRSGESRSGIGRLFESMPPAAVVPRADAAIVHYLEFVTRLRRERQDAHGYPGSPLLAAAALRAQDRAACFETQPAECRALQQTLAPYARTQVECADGWQRLKAVLPARERRALVLIDPPYEDGAADLAAARSALTLIVERQANAVVAIWYPLKDEAAISAWLASLAKVLRAPTLAAEFWLHPRDSALGLNGSGLVIVNPPWQLDSRLSVLQMELLARLGARASGRSASGGSAAPAGCSLRWLVPESASRGGAQQGDWI